MNGLYHLFIVILGMVDGIVLPTLVKIKVPVLAVCYHVFFKMLTRIRCNFDAQMQLQFFLSYSSAFSHRYTHGKSTCLVESNIRPTYDLIIPENKTRTHPYFRM